MKIFFNTKHCGLHKNTNLRNVNPISIGLISEDDKTFYAEFTDYDLSFLSKEDREWLNKNIISKLRIPYPNVHMGEEFPCSRIRSKDNEIGNDVYCGYSVEMLGGKYSVSKELKKWISQFKQIEMWGDTISCDWILIYDLLYDYDSYAFIENISNMPFDILTLFKIKGIDPQISRENYALNADVAMWFDIIGDLSSPTNKYKSSPLWCARVTRMCYNRLMVTSK
jgi:hypothetical protein